ncbi:hypothetical protein PsYK624_142630 [Phanerochaete sordida]|uniref:Uncharacterized protein n=1 Tax=Phanerochaete sordida TaxID=48140 RepID=A0A9P3GNM8_9APHY|nr:hypothetical protein PsYK624_142630 [Phanerochaete sordida]
MCSLPQPRRRSLPQGHAMALGRLEHERPPPAAVAAGPRYSFESVSGDPFRPLCVRPAVAIGSPRLRAVFVSPSFSPAASLSLTTYVSPAGLGAAPANARGSTFARRRVRLAPADLLGACRPECTTLRASLPFRYRARLVGGRRSTVGRVGDPGGRCAPAHGESLAVWISDSPAQRDCAAAAACRENAR